MSVSELLRKTGRQVAEEIGGRYLLRYVLPEQVGRFASGSDIQHYVTPTPYAPEETISYLALPVPRQPRTHVLVLDPARIEYICGPQRIAGAPGIQYILPVGFSQDAIVGAGAGAHWELEVR